VRFRDEKSGDVERTREVVRGWRAANPQGTPEQLLADVGHHFHRDWAPVLRSVLITVDRHPPSAPKRSRVKDQIAEVGT